MSRFAAAAAGLAGILQLSVAGCPTTEPVEVTIAGTWSGTLSCTSTQSLNGVAGDPTQGTRDVTIAFDADGVPTSLPIWGFVGAATQTVSISQVGQTASVDFASNSLSISLAVTVTDAGYTGSNAHIQLEVQYDAASGSLTQDGDATITIDASASGDQLTFSATADYNITQSAATISFETGETIECTGTLTRQ